MDTLSLEANSGGSIDREELEAFLEGYTDNMSDEIDCVLIIPPDATRKHSRAGIITNIIYHKLIDSVENIDIMPALGTHSPMEEEKLIDMFGDDIPLRCFKVHRWREDTVKIGEVPEKFINEVSEGKLNESIDVKINERLLDNKYDKIISIGQVLPHEVVGMANYTKNIVVGCGGKEIINCSHYLGAVYGLERLIGRDHSPVRRVYDYVEENLLYHIPLDYLLTVNKSSVDSRTGLAELVGIFIGRDRDVFEKAVELSRAYNIDFLETSVKKFVVYLSPEEFKSTWLGNKAIYRTRLAIAEGGELIIIAPGLETMGEDDEFDKLIRKYGYVSKEEVHELAKQNKDLQENLAVAAHLIHGSPEGEFKVRYASDNISAEELNEVGYSHIPLAEAKSQYDPEQLDQGINNIKEEKIYYIENPAVGLWAEKDKFAQMS